MEKKNILICIFLMILPFSLLMAELKVENLGSFQRILLYLDGSVVDFPKNETYSKSSLSLIIDDAKRDVVFKDYQELVIQKAGFDKNKSIVVVYYTELQTGKYNLYYTYRNDEFGSNYKKNFNFEIGTISDNTLPVVFDLNTHQLVADFKEMKGESNWLLDIAFSNKPDSVFLDINEDISIAVPTERIISFKIPVDYSNVIESGLNISWVISGVRKKLKIGNEQIIVIYSGKYSLKNQLEQLRYIATQKEWNELRKKMSDEEKALCIEKFWAHYQDGDSNHNSMRSLFYSRVLEADRMFSFKRYKKGWMTDRGRIYIKYGQPDEIVSEPLPLETEPYIIWYYYSLNKNFLFQDIKGFGDYELKNYQDED